MKRTAKIAAYLLSVVMLTTGAFAADAAKEIKANRRQDASIIIDGQEKIFKDSNGNALHLIEYDGVIHVPLQTVESASGKVSKWDPGSKQVQIGQAGEYITSPQNARAVYWVSGGKVYHATENCTTLKRSTNIQSGSVDQAKNAGKEAGCKVCNG